MGLDVQVPLPVLAVSILLSGPKGQSKGKRIYIYVCMYLCVYIYLSIYIYIYIYIYM